MNNCPLPRACSAALLRLTQGSFLEQGDVADGAKDYALANDMAFKRRGRFMWRYDNKDKYVSSGREGVAELDEEGGRALNSSFTPLFGSTRPQTVEDIVEMYNTHSEIDVSAMNVRKWNSEALVAPLLDPFTGEPYEDDESASQAAIKTAMGRNFRCDGDCVLAPQDCLRLLACSSRLLEIACLLLKIACLLTMGRAAPSAPAASAPTRASAAAATASGCCATASSASAR